MPDTDGNKHILRICNTYCSFYCNNDNENAPQSYFIQSVPLRYRIRHFFNNFTTNDDIATKFEAHYRHTLQTHSSSFLTQRTYSCSNFVAISSLVLGVIKEMPGLIASGTHCTYIACLALVTGFTHCPVGEC